MKKKKPALTQKEKILYVVVSIIVALIGAFAIIKTGSSGNTISGDNIYHVTNNYLNTGKKQRLLSLEGWKYIQSRVPKEYDVMVYSSYKFDDEECYNYGMNIANTLLVNDYRKVTLTPYKWISQKPPNFLSVSVEAKKAFIYVEPIKEN